MSNFCEDIEVCKRELINAALNAGGYDNVTIALMEVVEDDDDVAIADTCEFSTKKTKKKRKNKKGKSASFWGVLVFIIILLVIIALVLKNTELFDNIREAITNAIS